MYMTYRLSLGWLVASIVFWLGLVILTLPTLVLPVVALLLLLASVVRFLTTHLTLQAGGVQLSTGLFARRHEYLPWANINAVGLSVNPLGALLGYGALSLAVGNERNRIKVGNLGQAAAVKAAIEQHIYQR